MEEKKKITVKSYKVLKSFMAEREYNAGEIYKTSKKVDFLKTNKYIK